MKYLRGLIKSRTFERPLYIGELWTSDTSLTMKWAEIKFLDSGPNRHVRCGLKFQALIDKEFPQHLIAGRDPKDILMRLLCACVPHARSIFQERMKPARLLEMNDFVLEKAFVYSIISLSKWMGKDTFTYGIFGTWPPQPPADIAASFSHQQPQDLTQIGSKPSTAASSSSKPA
jgi:hypothetical protein